MSQIVTETEIGEAIDQVLAENRVVLFMKGTPEQPACGFSYRTVQALQGAGTDFVGINILPDPRIRQVLSAKSGWPTIPQLFVDGELIGGCDIVVELEESGELGKIVAPKAA
jgi:monothiol glutaredoxin